MQQLATQACGFITIVSGTFLLHTTKDLDMTAVSLKHILDRKDEDAAVGAGGAGGAALSAGSVRERRPVAAGLELGSLDGGKAEAAEKGLMANGGAGKDADDEHHPLISSTRKQRGLGTL
jgi:hypothetical protein